MSTAYTYPGIYVQELPLSTQTITPAPTSITTFVGYTHPWKTKAPFGTAVQLFSFTDYQNYFGGLYTSGILTSDVARAVYAFFLNGGNNAYVVGLQPSAYSSTDTSLGVFGSQTGQLVPTASITQTNIGIQLTAMEPTDVIPMTATVANLRKNSAGTAYTIFDLVITYGTRVEVYRSVDVTIAQGLPNSLDALVNGVSSLITVQPSAGTSYGTQFASGTPPAPVNLTLTLPAGFTTSFSEADFLVGNAGVGPVFQANSSLDNVEIFNLLLVPGVSDNNILSAALSFAERKRAFAIVDPPPQATAFQIPGSSLPTIQTMAADIPLSQNAALYFPYLNTTDPISSMPMAVAPSGYVAGVFATTDATRGVWKAPAGLAASVLGTTGPVASGLMNDMQQGVLNSPLPGGGTPVCCLRSFASTGTVVYGSRTVVGADPAYAQSKYVPVRRMTLFIEQTLIANLKWAVFEPNDEPLWLAIKSSIEAFLLSLFNQQALQGSTPSDAFQVKCDATTTTSADQQNGIVNIVVGVALLKPAEFVVIKIAQLAGQTS
jgi:phage tail sheath protein FI